MPASVSIALEPGDAQPRGALAKGGLGAAELHHTVGRRTRSRAPRLGQVHHGTRRRSFRLSFRLGVNGSAVIGPNAPHGLGLPPLPFPVVPAQLALERCDRSALLVERRQARVDRRGRAAPRPRAAGRLVVRRPAPVPRPPAAGSGDPCSARRSARVCRSSLSSLSSSFLGRPLGELDLRVVCIDGKVFRDHCMVVASGIDTRCAAGAVGGVTGARRERCGSRAQRPGRPRRAGDGRGTRSSRLRADSATVPLPGALAPCARAQATRPADRGAGGRSRGRATRPARPACRAG